MYRTLLSQARTKQELLDGIQISKAFGANVALDRISVSVSEGEILAVLGPSGSGKSTLLLCLAGIIPPDSGYVIYRGIHLRSLPDRELTQLRRQEFGFIFQFGHLIPDLSALENVAFPLRLSGISRGVAEESARHWLGKLEVEDVADKRIGEMSGGQAQRVAVARALVGQPSVIFADEPTGSLDSVNGQLVMELMVALAKDQRASIVLVTHEPRIAAYADREIIVRDGKLSELNILA